MIMIVRYQPLNRYHMDSEDLIIIEDNIFKESKLKVGRH